MREPATPGGAATRSRMHRTTAGGCIRLPVPKGSRLHGISAACLLLTLRIPLTACILLAMPGNLAASDPPEAFYLVTCHPSPAPARWEVVLTITGLDPVHRTLQMELSDWGEWSRVDAYYLHGLEGTPPLRRDPGRSDLFRLDSNSGGVLTEHGIRVGLEPRAEPSPLSPYTKQHLAHELCHLWFGRKLVETDRSLVWFKEGVNDYFSLWIAAKTGLVEKDWFADRLVELEEEARNQPVMGSVSFADSEVNWRESDKENLAYKGGALMAFFLDVELRRAGRPGVIELFRDIMDREGGVYSQAYLEQWLESHGPAEFHRFHLEGTEWPDLDEALEWAGYHKAGKKVPLTYLGIQCTADGIGGTITAVDPEGPAGKLNVRVGDRVTGYYPARSRKVEISKEVDTPYRFGLNRFEPGNPDTFFGVNRNGEDIKIMIRPRLIPGGVVGGYAADTEATDRFFRYMP